MKRLLPVAAALAALVLASPANAYWEYGHQTVAEIAWANITPKARREITRLLRQQKLLAARQFEPLLIGNSVDDFLNLPPKYLARNRCGHRRLDLLDDAFAQRG